MTPSGEKGGREGDEGSSTDEGSEGDEGSDPEGVSLSS
jgi:hypothetical protein